MREPPARGGQLQRPQSMLQVQHCCLPAWPMFFDSSINSTDVTVIHPPRYCCCRPHRRLLCWGTTRARGVAALPLAPPPPEEEGSW